MLKLHSTQKTTNYTHVESTCDESTGDDRESKIRNGVIVENIVFSLHVYAKFNDDAIVK